jgi:hypothetical protein
MSMVKTLIDFVKGIFLFWGKMVIQSKSPQYNIIEIARFQKGFSVIFASLLNLSIMAAKLNKLNPFK